MPNYNWLAITTNNKVYEQFAGATELDVKPVLKLELSLFLIRDGNRVLAVQRFDSDHRPIYVYFKKLILPSAQSVSCHMLGWQRSVGSHNVQHLAYLFEDGRVECGSKNQELLTDSIGKAIRELTRKRQTHDSGLYTWIAIYKDMTTLLGRDPQSGKHISAEIINRPALRAFALVNAEGRTVLTQYLEPNMRLIYRRRTAMTQGGTREICHLLGWQQNINGRNVQHISYVFEDDGRIEMAGRFREDNHWFIPIEYVDADLVEVI